MYRIKTFNKIDPQGILQEKGDENKIQTIEFNKSKEGRKVHRE